MSIERGTSEGGAARPIAKSNLRPRRSSSGQGCEAARIPARLRGIGIGWATRQAGALRAAACPFSKGRREMATQEELQIRLERLEAARASGILTVDYDGRRVTYRSDAELAAAIGYVRRQLETTARVTTIVLSTTKGLA